MAKVGIAHVFSDCGYVVDHRHVFMSIPSLYHISLITDGQMETVTFSLYSTLVSMGISVISFANISFTVIIIHQEFYIDRTNINVYR